MKEYQGFCYICGEKSLFKGAFHSYYTPFCSMNKIKKEVTNWRTRRLNMGKDPEQDAWRLPDDAIDLLDSKAINFIFDQGEKYLDELCKVSDSITGRCYTLLGIIFTICPFLVTTALSVGKLLFSVVAYLFAAVCIGVCIMLLLTMKPREGYSKGRDPKGLAYMPFMEHYKEKGISAFALYELENLQWKIDTTSKTNKHRARTFTIALWTLLVSFCTLLVFTMIFTSC